MSIAYYFYNCWPSFVNQVNDDQIAFEMYIQLLTKLQMQMQFEMLKANGKWNA